MPTKSRQFSFLRTMGSTALRATGEAIKKKVLGKEASSEPDHISGAAKRLVQGLDELKGAAMKMGQIMSLDKDLLPENWQAALSGLQSKSTPRDFEEIEKVLVKSLGSLNDFSHIEKSAIHAASMSQVHQAILKETHETVAVKVRYPGLKENIETDLKNVSRILKIAGVIAKEDEIKRVMKKVKEVFEQELDFNQECANTEKFSRFLAAECSFVTAVPVKKLCHEDVFVTSWLNGRGLEEWFRHDKPDEHERNTIGSLIVRLTLLEIFKFQFVQTDPNPANFLVMPDLKLGLVDFGATLPLSTHIAKPYQLVAIAALEGTKEQLTEGGIALGYLNSDDTQDAFDSFARMMAFTSEPFRYEHYDWGKNNLAMKIKEESLRFARHTRFRIPPEELIFLNRRILGTQLFLEKLGPKVSARKLFDEIVRSPLESPKDEVTNS